MPTYEELLQTDETLKHLERQYAEQWAKYQEAFSDDWPERFEVEQEVARRGQLIAECWEELRQVSRGETAA